MDIDCPSVLDWARLSKVLSESECDSSRSGLGVSASVVAPAPIFLTGVRTGQTRRVDAASTLSLEAARAHQAAATARACCVDLSLAQPACPNAQGREMGSRLCRVAQALHPPVLGTRGARENPVVVASRSSPREVE